MTASDCGGQSCRVSYDGSARNVSPEPQDGSGAHRSLHRDRRRKWRSGARSEQEAVGSRARADARGDCTGAWQRWRRRASPN